MWFGTGRGVSCFDGTAWETLTMKDWLACDVVTSLAVGRDGSIWVGTEAGVSQILIEEAK